MRVLVTGAAGFLATPTVARLRENGHEVVTTDRAGAVDHVGDLSDAAFVASLPEVDVVAHAAAVQYVTANVPLIRREEFFEKNNVQATRNLAERYDGKVDFFVNVGTSMMYDQTGLPIYTTSSPMGGQGVYSRSKLAAYQHVKAMKTPTATMIPSIIGGFGREGLFRGFVQSMTSRGVAVRPGTGRYTTHMVHVDDAAALLALIVESKKPGFYNAAGPEPTSLNSWIDIIQETLGLEKVRRIGVPYLPIKVGSAVTRYRIIAREQLLMLGQDHVLDTSESLALGWKPEYTNRRIVEDIARYIAGSSGSKA